MSNFSSTWQATLPGTKSFSTAAGLDTSQAAVEPTVAVSSTASDAISSSAFARPGRCFSGVSCVSSAPFNL